MGVFVSGWAAELNMSTRGCGGSSSSLPGTPGGESGPANRVLSWAVSFEKLLEDPCGVHHFTVSNKSTSHCAVILNRLWTFHVISNELCHLCSCTVCVFLYRPSWGLKWVQRTFYSGRLVKSSGRSQLAPLVRYDELLDMSFLNSLPLCFLPERSLFLFIKPLFFPHIFFPIGDMMLLRAVWLICTYNCSSFIWFSSCSVYKLNWQTFINQQTEPNWLCASSFFICELQHWCMGGVDLNDDSSDEAIVFSAKGRSSLHLQQLPVWQCPLLSQHRWHS